MSLMGSIVSKKLILSQNSSFLVKTVKIGSFWVPKWRHRWNFLHKTVSKIISMTFFIIKLVKTIINGINLVKLGHFWWKWSKSGHFGIFWAPKWRHTWKFGESGQNLYSLNVSKNYFSQIYGHKSGQKCH